MTRPSGIGALAARPTRPGIAAIEAVDASLSHFVEGLQLHLHQREAVRVVRIGKVLGYGALQASQELDASLLESVGEVTLGRFAAPTEEHGEGAESPRQFESIVGSGETSQLNQ